MAGGPTPRRGTDPGPEGPSSRVSSGDPPVPGTALSGGPGSALPPGPAHRDDLDWEPLGSRYGADLKILRVRHDALRHPWSGQVLERVVLEASPWVNCVARTADGRLVMVEQYRFGVAACTLETPGGLVDPGETPLEAMQRELTEETGFGGGTWTDLGAVEANPAFLDNLCHHFLVDGVEPVGEPDLGAGEAIRVHLMTLEEVRRAIDSCWLRHSLALSVLSRVYDLFPRR